LARRSTLRKGTRPPSRRTARNARSRFDANTPSSSARNACR
jgi:hypothetical protein